MGPSKERVRQQNLCCFRWNKMVRVLSESRKKHNNLIENHANTKELPNYKGKEESDEGGDAYTKKTALKTVDNVETLMI